MSDRDFQQTLKLLRNVASIHEVETALNAIAIPEKDAAGQHSPLFLSMREPLRVALEALQSKEGITNKAIRRRISRFLHVLADGDSTAAKPKPKPPNSAGNVVKGDVASTVAVGPVAVAVAKKDLTEFLGVLRSAKSAEELDQSLSGFSVESVAVTDYVVVPNVVAHLESLLSGTGNADQQLVKNAKTRRKVTRLTEMLKGLTEPATSSGLKTGGSSESKHPMTAVAKARGAPVTAPQPQKAPAPPAVKAVFNPPPGPPLEGVIEKVRACDDLDQLDEIVSEVKPNSGSAASRRLLKRLLDRKLAEKDALMNAKQRRKFKRVQQVLEAKPGSGVKFEPVVSDDDGEGGRKDSSKKKAALEGGDGPQRIPYIVFIGQLSYDTTKEELEDHLRRNHIEGPLIIRMLSKSINSSSDDTAIPTAPAESAPSTSGDKIGRGMAFVEVEGAREMHKCIALHHSVLKGRRINVEKSCGGKNKDSRQDKLRQQRLEQSAKVSETIDRILGEYEEQGVIAVDGMEERVKDQLHNYTPTMVRQIFEKFAALDASQRCDKELGRIIYLATRQASILGAGSKPSQTDGPSAPSSNRRRRPNANDGVGDEGMDAQTSNEDDTEDAHKVRLNKRSRTSKAPSVADSDAEPITWGYSTEPYSGPDSVESNAIEDLFPSVRGRGGKLMVGRRDSSRV